MHWKFFVPAQIKTPWLKGTTAYRAEHKISEKSNTI
jgi:hypothetical protein